MSLLVNLSVSPMAIPLLSKFLDVRATAFGAWESAQASDKSLRKPTQ